MSYSEYENLTASSSITIDLPVEQTWKLLTQPQHKYDWIGSNTNEKNIIFSSWKEGEPITWQYFNDETNKFEDYYRGQIVKVVPEKEIEFTIYSAFDQDIAKEQEDEQPDIHEETWGILFDEVDGKTKLTLNIYDFDAQHIDDDEHDHEETLQNYKEVCEVIIPSELSRIKKFCESK